MPDTETPGAVSGTDGAARPGVDVEQLVDLAIQGLPQMYDAENRLFCVRLYRANDGLVREGVSVRYTLISLMGLHKYEARGRRPPIEVRPVLDSLLSAVDSIGDIGDLGLLLWLCALAAPEHLPTAFASDRVQRAMTYVREGGERRTMELAWFVAGLAHASMALLPGTFGLEDTALHAQRVLTENQGGYGFFGHAARTGRISRILRGHIGSFADQVYPIYALVRFSQAYAVPTALQRARRCAEALCSTQGPLGQWWWHYDAAGGGVFEQYPVYSVHQDGMAPMALFSIGEATGADFSGPIRKGLGWIAKNELRYNLCDASDRVIWRSVYHGCNYRTHLRRVAALSGARRKPEPFADLRITFECRPYHLGWLLYAFCGRESLLS